MKDQGSEPLSTYVEPPTRFPTGTEAWLYFRGRDRKLHAFEVETGTTGLRYHSGIESLFFHGVKLAKDQDGGNFKPPMLLMLINPNPVVPNFETPKERA